MAHPWAVDWPPPDPDKPQEVHNLEPLPRAGHYHSTAVAPAACRCTEQAQTDAAAAGPTCRKSTSLSACAREAKKKSRPSWMSAHGKLVGPGGAWERLRRIGFMVDCLYAWDAGPFDRRLGINPRGWLAHDEDDNTAWRSKSNICAPVILTAASAAPCLRISCSRKKKVRLWYTCCRTCVHETQRASEAVSERLSEPEVCRALRTRCPGRRPHDHQPSTHVGYPVQVRTNMLVCAHK